MQIVRRIDSSAAVEAARADQIVIDDATVQQFLHFSQPMRPMACADHPDMGVVDGPA